MQIKAILFDVDGVWTDGKITYTNINDELKSFHVHDGLAVNMALKAGIKIGLITSRQSNSLIKRASELGVYDIYMNVKDKVEALENFIEKYGFNQSNCAYMGDDLIDLRVMAQVAYKGAPANAVSEIKARVDYVCVKNGGEGAVREFIEHILKKMNIYDEIIQSYL